MAIGLAVGCLWAAIFGVLALRALLTRRASLCYWHAPITVFVALLAVSSIAVAPIMLLRDHFEYWADAYLVSALAWFGAMHALAIAFRRRLLLPDDTTASTLMFVGGNVAVISSYVANGGGGNSLLGGDLGVGARVFWAFIAVFGIAQLAVIQKYLGLLRSDFERTDRRRLLGYQIGNAAGMATLAYALGVAIGGDGSNTSHHVALVAVVGVAFAVQLAVASRPRTVKVGSDEVGRGRGLRPIKVPVKVHSG
jgi:hypothetical protein